MPYENLRVGQKVKVMGKEGKIIDVADNYKVKFDDGNFGFFDGNNITPYVVDTRLKSSDLKNETVFMSEEAQRQDPFTN